MGNGQKKPILGYQCYRSKEDALAREVRHERISTLVSISGNSVRYKYVLLFIIYFWSCLFCHYFFLNSSPDLFKNRTNLFRFIFVAGDFKFNYEQGCDVDASK